MFIVQRDHARQTWRDALFFEHLKKDYIVPRYLKSFTTWI